MQFPMVDDKPSDKQVSEDNYSTLWVRSTPAVLKLKGYQAIANADNINGSTANAFDGVNETAIRKVSLLQDCDALQGVVPLHAIFHTDEDFLQLFGISSHSHDGFLKHVYEAWNSCRISSSSCVVSNDPCLLLTIKRPDTTTTIQAAFSISAEGFGDYFAKALSACNIANFPFQARVDDIFPAPLLHEEVEETKPRSLCGFHVIVAFKLYVRPSFGLEATRCKARHRNDILGRLLTKLSREDVQGLFADLHPPEISLTVAIEGIQTVQACTHSAIQKHKSRHRIRISNIGCAPLFLSSATVPDDCPQPSKTVSSCNSKIFWFSDCVNQDPLQSAILPALSGCAHSTVHGRSAKLANMSRVIRSSMAGNITYENPYANRFRRSRSCKAINHQLAAHPSEYLSTTTQVTNKFSILDLPQDILDSIFSLLCPQAFRRFRQCSSHAYTATKHSAPGLHLKLMPHQVDAVFHMERMEHRCTIPVPSATLYTQDGRTVFYDLLSGGVCMHRPIMRLRASGGILADEPGLGKTISVLALILRTSDAKGGSFEHTTMADEWFFPVGATMIVCPETMVSHWYSQFQQYSQGLKIDAFKKGCRSQRKLTETHAATCDVIIISMEQLEVEHRHSRSKHSERQSRGGRTSSGRQSIATSRYLQESDLKSFNQGLGCTSPAFKYRWRRVVVDEGHLQSTTASTVSSAWDRVWQIDTGSLWQVTGTPAPGKTASEAFSRLHKSLHYWSTGNSTKPSVFGAGIKKNSLDHIGLCHALLESFRIIHAKSDVNLPPLHQLVVSSKPRPGDINSYNQLVAAIRRNLRTAGNYKSCHRESLLHPRNRRPAQEAIDNILAASCAGGRVALHCAESQHQLTVGFNSSWGADATLCFGLAEKVCLTSDFCISEGAQVADHNCVEYQWLPPLFCDRCSHRVLLPFFLKCSHVICDQCLFGMPPVQALSIQTLEIAGTSMSPANRAHKKFSPNVASGKKPLASENKQVDPDDYRMHICPKCQTSHMWKSIIEAQPAFENVELPGGWSKSTGGKTVALIKHLKEFRCDQEGGRKVVVYSQFEGYLEALCQALNAARFQYCIHFSRTKDKDSQLLEFQRSKVKNVLLMDKSGVVGIDLFFASAICIMQTVWDPEERKQLEGRIQRIGSKEAKYCIEFQLEGSIEQAPQIQYTECYRKVMQADNKLSEDRFAEAVERRRKEEFLMGLSPI